MWRARSLGLEWREVVRSVAKTESTYGYYDFTYKLDARLPPLTAHYLSAGHDAHPKYFITLLHYRQNFCAISDARGGTIG